MRVLLVTSEGACGISEHSHYLKANVEAADPSIQIRFHHDLHPNSLCQGVRIETPEGRVDIVHLNYHAGLHSQWRPEHVKYLSDFGTPVVVTWHDSGVPNSDHCKSIYEVADAFVVHEPCEDLPEAHYWRQGVPDWAVIPNDAYAYHAPCLGSVGFAFPWKNYDLLAEATARAGWDLKLLAPRATPEQIAGWKARNPRTFVWAGFSDRVEVVRQLAVCDATAFVYNNCNTGTSGAIRQGIAARKPVIASTFPAGRQFRDLQSDPLASRVITWIEPGLDQLVKALSEVKIAPLDAGMVALAAQDSWTNVGKNYARLYRSLL